MSNMFGWARPRRWAWTVAPFVLAFVAVAFLFEVIRASPVPSSGTPSRQRPVAGVHVVANRLVTAAGSTVQLGGVGRSGTEYACLGGRGVFVGPTGPATVAAMAEWHIDAVRLPLNEDCWLGINGLSAASSGAAYRNAIAGYVRQLEDRGIVVDLDLHWSAPGGERAASQQQMADVDHSVRFWQDVASAFRNDPHVLFELYNEPYGVTWSCWRDGCAVPASRTTPAYQAAGMQKLVDSVRATGARNPLLLDGLAKASDLGGWRAYEPFDPAHALVAAWHIYGPSGCGPSCWQQKVSEVHGTPLLVTELGQNDCGSSFVSSLMSWLDRRDIGYLAWAWNTWPGCKGPSLITGYSGTPHTRYGEAVRKHLETRF
jgi:endoglucanase